ncbi:MAG TPA: lytic transglycosylase domain-containing protein [Solirubrobacteraceae bacterium]|nr:lytic transglycosylase domain-containing protein [Solirubrobacteraceae bacterium]
MVALAVIVAIIALAVTALQSSPGIVRPPAGAWLSPPSGELPGYRPGAAAALSQRAATGSAQALFTLSPGGVPATAARVARFEPQIDAAVRGTDIPAGLLAGLVFLESAGRPYVVAGGSVQDAAGLTQILPSTGSSVLGLHIDLARSGPLLAAAEAAQSAGAAQRLARLNARLAKADQRFDPALALAATVRYLQMAERQLGRLDLAVAAYHAGIGNLQTVLDDYAGGRPVSYAQLYFDTSPARHAPAWSFLSNLGDDSSHYWWRVIEAERLMHMYRSQPEALRRLAGLETGYPSDALALLPSGVQPFAGPASLSAAYQDHELVPLPRDPGRLHLTYAPEMGALARHWRVPVAIYRGLRPSALAVLTRMAAAVHQLAGGSLTVTSTVLDRRYQRRLGYVDPPGATGFTFQIRRRYSPAAQAPALQFVLDRLQALDLIGWIRGARTIEVSAAPDAARVLRSGV